MTSETTAQAQQEIAAAYALLIDGTAVSIRAPHESDAEEVYRMFAGMSAENRRMRFFVVPDAAALRSLAQRICRPPEPGRGALLALRESRVVGVAQYDPSTVPGVSEIAVAVADEMHGRGVGTLLVEHLASYARRGGVREFRAEVLTANREMLSVFAATGLPMHRTPSYDETQISIPLDVDERYLAATHTREGQAGRASLSALLRPSTIAVIGASRRASSVGHAVLRNIREGGFTGSLYAVNPHAKKVAGVPSFPGLAKLPNAPDLAVVAVPPGAVLDVARDCARHGVRGLVVITSGLDADTQRELLSLCRDHDMRLIGPNCFGVGNTAADMRLQATFAADAPTPGRTGVVVQSGGVGIALLEHLSRLDVGVSTFASLGDKLDVSGNDLLMWWEAEESTRLGVVYLESFGNPRKFSWLARRVGRRIPLLTVLAGQSEAGQRAAASHTAAAATPARTTEALFRQAGVIATRDLGELVETAALLAHQPLPEGPRVGIVTNAGGAGVLAADACADAGLTVRHLDEATRAALSAELPPGAACGNPVDTGADAAPEQIRAAVRAVADSPEVDVVMVLLVPTALAAPSPDTVAVPTGKPVLGVALGQAESVSARPVDGGAPLPCYGSPAVAARALGHAWRYADWRARPQGTVRDPSPAEGEPAREIAAAFLDEHPEGGWLPSHLVLRLLRHYGIEAAPWRWAASAEEAAEAAAELGTRVVLKGEVRGVVHKSQAGALALDLPDAEAARHAYRRLQERFGERLRGALVQSMAAPGLELMFGVNSDPVFGPVVVYGLGGVHTDALDVREVRLTPLTDTDAAQLIGSLPVTAGGEEQDRRVDTGRLEEIALSLSQLATELPEVAELDLNPVIVDGRESTVVDARIRVRQAARTDPYLRRLR